MNATTMHGRLSVNWVISLLSCRFAYEGHCSSIEHLASKLTHRRVRASYVRTKIRIECVLLSRPQLFLPAGLARARLMQHR